MSTTVSTATSIDGTTFDITRFVPLSVQQSKEKTVPHRAVIYTFGGGLVAGSVAISHNMIANFAEQTATQVFAPDHRLAPENPSPAALDDVYTTITWLQAHAGDAGGTLVAAAALKAKDEGLSPPIAAQVLRCPMLDDRTQMEPENPRFPYLTWFPGRNTIVWKAYLKGFTNGMEVEGISATVPDTAAPARADDLHGLPPTHLGVGGLDLFRDESTSFAARLSSHGVEVQSHVYPGVPHGFDGSPAFALRLELWSNEANIRALVENDAELSAFPVAEGSKIILVNMESVNFSGTEAAVKELTDAGIDHADLVIANACVTPAIHPPAMADLDDATKAFTVNALGPWSLFKALLPLLQKSQNAKWMGITTTLVSLGSMETGGLDVTY
ncbi:Alpha/Beta hydrolase protein [Apiospora phragmitis]|uniref:Alpha/Beta hydrolase protein n=1 Tax=Apiospora phragmitis TaxID=2905665 RepID=A0ABR1TNJ9_9PEZI